MSNSSSVNNTTYYIHSTITVLLIFGFGFLPTVGDITPLGMDVLGIFLGMLYGWIFCGLLWPSMLGIFALGLTDYTTMTGAWAAALGHNNTLIVLTALLFGYYLDKSGLSHTIAYKFITAKVTVGHPWIFITLYFLACYIIGAVVNLFAGIILMCTIFYQIAKILDIKKQSPFAAYMIIGICFITVLGSYALPIKESPLFLRGIMEPTLGMALPFLPWIIWFNIMHLMATAVYLLIGKFILRLDTKILKEAGDFLSDYRVKGLPSEQRLPLLMLAIFVAVLIFPSFMPPSWELTVFLNKLGLVGIGMAIIIFLLIARDKDGQPLADFKDMINHGINWDLVLLIAATMPIGAAMESGETGIIAWLTAVLLPLAQSMGSITLIIFVTVVFCAISQVAHNMVLMIVMIPLLESIAIAIGSNPIALALMFNYGVALAMITPGASAQAAMFHGNTEWVTTKQAYVYSIITVILQLIAGLIIGIPLVHILFPWS